MLNIKSDNSIPSLYTAHCFPQFNVAEVRMNDDQCLH